jgi:hypothetical protein
VDGKEAAKGRIEKTVLGRFSVDETLDSGEDTGSPVSGLYEAPFRFGGTTRRTEIDLAPETLGAVDIEEPKKADTCASRRVRRQWTAITGPGVRPPHEGCGAEVRPLWLASSVPLAAP